VYGSTFSDGFGTNAGVGNATQLAIDSSSQLYIFDQINFVMRKLEFTGHLAPKFVLDAETVETVLPYLACLHLYDRINLFDA
jgi:hypothetical protein